MIQDPGMWSPDLSSFSMVVLIAVMRLEVTIASSVFSSAATFAAKAYVAAHNLCHDHAMMMP